MCSDVPPAGVRSESAAVELASGVVHERQMTPLTHTLRAWNRASDHVLSSMVEANRATLAAFGVPEDADGEFDDGAAVDPSIQHEQEPWEHDRTVEEPTAIERKSVV